jgi:PKD repeat protein
VTDAKDGKLALSWATATDNVAVDYYRIYRDNVFLINSTTTSYQNTGLTNGPSYTYNVSAVDTSGNEGERSDAVSGTPTPLNSGGNPPAGEGGSPPVGGNSDNNAAPVANLSAGKPYSGSVGSPVTFNGSWSTDSDGNITDWFWDFGDGTNDTGIMVTHSYSEQGVYTVTLTVTDDENDTDSDTTTIKILAQNIAPTNPIIYGITTGHKNSNYTFTAFSTDANNDTIRYTVDWDDGSLESSEFLPNGTSWTKNHSWAAAGKYIITITAADNQADSSCETTIWIDTLNVDGFGYLIDNDSDGTFDHFHYDTNGETSMVEEQDGAYSIDVNADSQYDYVFDPALGTMNPLRTESHEESSWLFAEIIILIVLIIGLLAVVLYKKGYI